MVVMAAAVGPANSTAKSVTMIVMVTMAVAMTAAIAMVAMATANVAVIVIEVI